MISNIIKKLVNPEDYSSRTAVTVTFLTMTVIFACDIYIDGIIELHHLYVFPITMMALHCENLKIVVSSVILTIIYYSITIISDGQLTVTSKLFESIMVVPTFIVVAYLSRVARTNMLSTQQIARIDSLTGLNNRRSIESIIDREIERQKRYGGFFSFALLDLDGFKALNDSRGHHVGDEALKIVADLLQNNSRQSDVVGRLGGDEFVILMPNTPAVDCFSHCEQLALKIKDQMKNASFSITASIGCTTIDQTPNSALDVLIKADSAMYAAKTNCKGGVVRL